MNTNAVDVALSFIGLGQAQHYHESSEAQDRRNHAEEIRLLKEQQAEEIKTVKQTYLMNSFADTERHFQQLNADLINSCKEFEKDMVDQRSLWCQTIIVAATIMLTALTAVLIQGNLPETDDLPPAGAILVIDVVYSISNAGSMAALFVSILLHVEVIIRIGNFSIDRSARHERFLRSAFEKSKNDAIYIRPESPRSSSRRPEQEVPSSSPGRVDPDPDEVMLSYQRQDSVSTGISVGESKYERNSSSSSVHSSSQLNSPFSSSRLKKRGHIVKLNANEFDEEWESHEATIREFLDNRDVINKETSYIFSNENGFERYWEDHCSRFSNLALLLYYIGTAFMMTATMVYMWATYTQTYANYEGAELSVVIISFSIVAGMSLAVFLRTHSDFHVPRRPWTTTNATI